MTQSMFRLAYISRNLGVWDEQELDGILRTSRRNNAAVEVTGALLFNERCFAQVLEGPLGAVSATFERVQFDDRHGDVTVLLSENDVPRRFGDWAMGYIGEDAEAQTRFATMRFDALRAGPDQGGRDLLSLMDGAATRFSVLTYS